MKISSVTLNSPLSPLFQGKKKSVDYTFLLLLPPTVYNPKTPQSLSLVGSGHLDILDDGLQLFTDLGGIGRQHLSQLVDLSLQGGAQVLGCGLHLGLEGLSLGLQLLAQTLCLALQDGGEVSQLLGGSVASLVDVGLNLLSHSIQVLSGAGVELTQVGCRSAGGEEEGGI